MAIFLKYFDLQTKEIVTKISHSGRHYLQGVTLALEAVTELVVVG